MFSAKAILWFSFETLLLYNSVQIYLYMKCWILYVHLFSHAVADKNGCTQLIL